MADNYKVILEKVLEVTSKIGETETIKLLDSINEFGGDITVLLSSIKSRLNISISEIKRAKNKELSDRLFYAKIILAYILYTELDFSQSEISNLMDKKIRTVRHYIDKAKEVGDTPFLKEQQRLITEITNDLNEYTK